MQTTDHDISKYDKYFITPDYNHSLESEYFSKIEQSLKSGIQLLQFRSKNLSIKDYAEVSKKIYSICLLYKAKYIINDYINLQLNSYCDGIQLTSDNLRNTNLDRVNKKYIIIASCHNIEEIKVCNNSNVHLVLISPVLNTKNKNGIGWEAFRELTRYSKKPVFGLGGLNYNTDIKTVKINGGVGIAASSYFYHLFDAGDR